MGLVIKESLKSTLITFIGALLGGVSLLLASTMLEVEEYGIQQYVYKNASLVAYISLLGFDYSLLVLAQRYGVGSAKRGAFLRYMAKIPLLIAFIITVIFILLKEPFLEYFVNPDERPMVDQYFYSIIIIFGLHVLLIWIEGYLRSANKSTYVYLVHDVIIRVIYLILILSLAFDFISFPTFIWLYAISFVIPLGMVLKSALSDRGFTFNIDAPLSSTDKKEIFSFSFFHALTIVSSILVFQIDSLLFPMIASDGLKDLAVYSLGIYCASILRLPLKVVASNAVPTLTAHYDRGEINKVRELFTRSALNLQILAVLMILLILCNLNSISAILVQHWNTEYHVLTEILPIMMIGILIELSCGLNFEIIGISKYYKFNFWLAIVYIIIIIISYYVLIGSWGIFGAAWAFTISIALFNIGKGLFTNSKLGMTPVNKDTIKVLIISAAIGIVFYLMPDIINPFFSIAFKSSLIIILYIYLHLKWKVGEDLPRVVGMLFQKLKIK